MYEDILNSPEFIDLETAITKVCSESVKTSNKLYWWVAENHAKADEGVVPLLQQYLNYVTQDSVKYYKSRREFVLDNGSKVAVKSGQKGDNLRGFALDGVILSRWLGRDATYSTVTGTLKTKGWVYWVKD